MEIEDASSAVFGAEEMRIIRRFGDQQRVAAGEVLFTAGDVGQAFFVIESGEVEIVRPATPDAPESVLVTHGVGRFIGELNLLSGQRAYLTARVSTGGLVVRVEPEAFAQMMRQEASISTTVLDTFLARRAYLRIGEGARSVDVVGSRWSPASLALRTWLARLQIPHLWMDVDDPEGSVLATAIGARSEDLPCVVTSAGVLRHATPSALARDLGLHYRQPEGRVRDLVVIGGGPAGLGAAVCAASEGLDTLIVDETAIGGQAAASARIENYIGFPSGIAGAELTSRALVQAYKFGATVSSPSPVTQLMAVSGHLQVVLGDGSQEQTRTVIIATGASYRTLSVANWEKFDGTSIFYAATELEARACSPAPVIVVGGANSAGQASIFLAGHGSPVTLVVRGADLATSMSQYLIGRIEADPRITVTTDTAVAALHGNRHVEAVTLTQLSTNQSHTQPCQGVFCFIGAAPATSFVAEVATDQHGFILTDKGLRDTDLGGPWRLLRRDPLPYESSIPGVFAVGDVRSGSVKRVATAVGEGSAVVGSIHSYLTSQP